MMEQLRQENHDLRQKLQLAQQMELDYLEEIRQLKEAAHTASVSQPESTSYWNRSRVMELEEQVEMAENKAMVLQEDLQASKEQNAILKERIAAVECRLESHLSEISISGSESNQQDQAALIEELARLKMDLDNSEMQRCMERSRFERLLAESEEERSGLQSELCELQRHLKESRSALSEVQAELESMKVAANSITSTRGNSAFSELDDRRVRAEKLVRQQREKIEQLTMELNMVHIESQRKLTEEVRKLEIRYRERDTEFADKLVSERKRLSDENRTLTLQLQQLEELQLDDERRAVKMSQAFSSEGQSQASLLGMLEKRVSTLQQRLTEKTMMVEGLHERLLKAGLQRRQMQADLWDRTDETIRLREKLKQAKSQLAHSSSPQLVPPSQSISPPFTANVAVQSESNVDLSLPTAAAELRSTPSEDCENRNPQNCPNIPLKELDVKTRGPTKPPITNLNSLPVLKESEFPPDCKTS